jgi:hypothetical protein
VLLASGAHAGNGTPINTGSAETLTLAVFGDWPYGPDLFAAAPLLIDSITDMWDPAATVPGGDGLGGYTAFVRVLADLSVHLGKPLLLITGTRTTTGRISRSRIRTAPPA